MLADNEECLALYLFTSCDVTKICPRERCGNYHVFLRSTTVSTLGSTWPWCKSTQVGIFLRCQISHEWVELDDTPLETVSIHNPLIFTKRPFVVPCSPPGADRALVEGCQFLRSTCPCWLLASWERVDRSWHQH